ncbi:hypothetical protein H0H92_015454, partial [Tricholoma furcatifolium]
GLEFLHENNIRHGSELESIKFDFDLISLTRDCKYDNIMVDGFHLYKDPPHPFAFQRTLAFRQLFPPVFSRTIKPVKYYLIDFDLAKEYPPGAPRLERPPWGGDKSVPEHQLDNLRAPCDPFPVDVYCLGNCIREEFLD